MILDIDKSVLTTNIGMITVSLIFISFLAIIYFTKKNMDNAENKVFKLMIIGILVELICSLIYRLLQINSTDETLILHIITKIKMASVIYFYFFIDLYKVVIIKQRKPDFLEKFNKNKEKIYYLISLFLIYIFMLVMLLSTNLEFDSSENILGLGSCGLTVLWLIVFLIETVSYVIITIFSIGKIEKKKLIPFLVIDFFYIALFFDRMFVGYVLSTLERGIVVFVMYHTIENPDMKMVQEVTLAKQQAEKSNNAKSDFLASMSHELRTPLNAIVKLSQLIESEATQEEVKHDAKDIVVASENLLELVNGILDINKLEANELEKIEINYNPKQMVNELDNMIKVHIGEKNITLRTKYSEELPTTLYGDRDNLKRIISYLLTNAVKYTNEGYIDFNIECTNIKDKCNLRITVTDTGRGISEERIPELFTKFNRLESDKDSDIQGTGLGLAITKSLIDLLGGKISVNSTEGVGTTFMVTLTQDIKTEASPVQEEEIHSKTEVTNVTNNELNNQIIEDNQSNNRKKLLVVDDNKLNLKVASKLLENFDFDVETSNSGFECIDKISNQNKYDLIFMDIMMPDMDGVETMKKLKNMSLKTPIVALTADAVEGSRERYLEEGFDDYVAKPIDQMTLEETLHKLLHLNVITENEANTYKENYNRKGEEETEIL